MKGTPSMSQVLQNSEGECCSGECGFSSASECGSESVSSAAPVLQRFERKETLKWEIGSGASTKFDT